MLYISLKARKQALSSLKAGKGEGGKPAAPATLPPPGVALPGVVQAPPGGVAAAAAAEGGGDKSKTLAALQAQIAARLKNVGIPAVAPQAPAGPIAGVQPKSLILNAEGRTVDATGAHCLPDFIW